MYEKASIICLDIRVYRCAAGKENSMPYLKESLKRASVQSLREYLLYGVDGECHTAKSYEVRIKKAFETWSAMVKEYEEDWEASRLFKCFVDVLSEHEHVYMEIGIQAGFQLAKDLERSGEEEGLCGKYKDMYSSLFQDVTVVIEELQKAQKEAEEIFISNIENHDKEK